MDLHLSFVHRAGRRPPRPRQQPSRLGRRGPEFQHRGQHGSDPGPDVGQRAERPDPLRPRQQHRRRGGLVGVDHQHVRHGCGRPRNGLAGGAQRQPDLSARGRRRSGHRQLPAGAQHRADHHERVGVRRRDAGSAQRRPDQRISDRVAPGPRPGRRAGRRRQLPRHLQSHADRHRRRRPWRHLRSGHRRRRRPERRRQLPVQSERRSGGSGWRRHRRRLRSGHRRRRDHQRGRLQSLCAEHAVRGFRGWNQRQLRPGDEAGQRPELGDDQRLDREAAQ